MPETSSPGLAEVSWAQCQCKPCKVRRQEKSRAPGCPCAECQPGPGIDYVGNGRVRTATRRAEMQLLLRKSARDELTDAEADRLDGLLHEYLHGN